MSSVADGILQAEPRAGKTASHQILAIVLVGVALLIAWRVVILGLAEHHMASDQPAQVLALLPGHPIALESEAMRVLGSDPEAAIALLERAVAENPVRGITHVLLSGIWDEQGHDEAARRAIAAAVRLAPAKVDLRLVAAGMALRDGDMSAALEHWDVALTRRRSLSAELFPALLTFVGRSEYLPAFERRVQSRKVEWWSSFVAHGAGNAKELDTVMALYRLSSASSENRLAGPALGAVLRRLQREGLWLDARLAWMDSLPEEQVDGMGNLFNGSFEYPVSDIGFDWVRARAGHVLVEVAPTFGTSDAKALHVLFRGPRVRYRHLTQLLTLYPGEYVLRGRSRADGLEANPGLMWTISCLGARERLIAQTTHFRGRGAWRGFEKAFTVPAEDCPAQVLRLQLDGRVALDFEAKGSIWFDDMTVEPLTPKRRR